MTIAIPPAVCTKFVRTELTLPHKHLGIVAFQRPLGRESGTAEQCFREVTAKLARVRPRIVLTRSARIVVAPVPMLPHPS